MAKQLIIVTGAGRSGTSAVARVFHESGCSMGDELHEAGPSNPAGYYEDKWITWVNDGILAATGLDRFFGHATREQVLAAAERYRGDMQRIASEAGGGWKDPRFCWTLEAWLPALEAPPKVVVCLRSPRAVADSAVRHYGQTSVYARRHIAFQWSRQYDRLLEVVREYGLEAICVEYEDLVGEPEATVEWLSRFAGRPLDASAVDRTLRHEAGPVPKHHRSMYRRVRALSGV
jgi:hypothetical protein